MGACIVIAGGGTGGHVFPALAVATELKRRDPSREILFLGANRGIETKLVPSAGFPLKTLPLGGLAGGSILRRALAAAQAGLAVARCVAIFIRRRPSAVLGVGGYASGPAVLAALTLRIPTLIHEQNATPGMTNRWLAPYVDDIAISFSGTESALGGRGTVTGNPTRDAFFKIAPYTGMGERLRLLIFGGSRGAHTLNRTAVASLDHLADLKDRISIQHQTGEADHAAAAEAYRRSGFDATASAFFDDMPSRLANSDLAVARAGAGTVFELAAAGRASILVPYPYSAGGHQDRNASWMAAAGAATVVPDAQFTGEVLARLVREALSDPSALAARAAAARTLSCPDAASRIASIVERLSEGRR
jgi:UDP-N-acetylglucosamine--N-acetylmuramyl-(pentapeptide) pyrophosphoryl-undecaprenol N-acetylglucosamine transferase